MAAIIIERKCETCSGTGTITKYGQSPYTCPSCFGATKLPFADSDELDARLSALALPTNVFRSHVVWEATDLTEYQALTEAQKEIVERILRELDLL